MLPELFRNAEKEMALHLLDLLEASRKRWLGRYLLVALNREEPEIRLRSLLLLFDQDANLSHQVRFCARTEMRGSGEKQSIICAFAPESQRKDAEVCNRCRRCCSCRLLRVSVEKQRDKKGWHRRMETLLEESGEEAGGSPSRNRPCPGARTRVRSGSALYDRLLADPLDDFPSRRSEASRARNHRCCSLTVEPHPQSSTEAARKGGAAGFGEIAHPLLANVAENNQETEARRKLALNVAPISGNSLPVCFCVWPGITARHCVQRHQVTQPA